MFERLKVGLDNKNMHDYLDTLLGGDLVDPKFCAVEVAGITFGKCLSQMPISFRFA